jgi:hypothetical protein
VSKTVETAQQNRGRRGAELENALAQCWGSDYLIGHWTRRLNFTQGVHVLAEKGGAYWLIDAIASHQTDKRLVRSQRLREFQLWELKVKPDRSCTLTCRADSNEAPVITQEIEYTDFPLDEITLYVEGDVLLLPSEH